MSGNDGRMVNMGWSDAEWSTIIDLRRAAYRYIEVAEHPNPDPAEEAEAFDRLMLAASFREDQVR